MVWNDDGTFWGARIKAHEFHRICFGRVDAEALALLEDRETVFIGTLQGLIRWNVSSGEVETVAMPNNERIVQLFWSRSIGALFIGCRHGEVYKLAGTRLD
jgi:ligand-binding sensor domain-containing protein